MKRYIFIVLLFFFTFHVNGQGGLYDSLLNNYDSHGRKSGKWVEYWPGTGRLKSVEYFSGGKRNGLCIYLNEYGYLIEESEYVDDHLNGISKRYSDVGTLTESAEFANGRKEGFTRYYDYKRHVTEEIQYHNDLRHGTRRIFYPSGRVQSEETFVEGKRNGTSRHYKDSDEREIISESDFIDDLKVERRKYRRGRLIRTDKEISPPKENALKG